MSLGYLRRLGILNFFFFFFFFFFIITMENDVKICLFSLAYLTPIKLPFCKSTGEREREI